MALLRCSGSAHDRNGRRRHMITFIRSASQLDASDLHLLKGNHLDNARKMFHIFCHANNGRAFNSLINHEFTAVELTLVPLLLDL